MAQEFKEKNITISLKEVFAKPATKRAKVAKNLVKTKVIKETRKKEVWISNKVNEALWARGLFKSLRKITVKVVSDKDVARVYLPDEKIEVKEDKKGKKEETKKTEEKKETPKTEKKEAPKAVEKAEVKTEEKKE